MLGIIAILFAIGILVYTLWIRVGDLPEAEPVSPTKHLEERKATIYENLRDLQFEYRLGKLSDADYQQTKKDLQKELALVVAEMERMTAPAAAQTHGAQPKPAPAPAAKQLPNECPHCGAKFPKPMKFCGECGKPLLVEAK